MHCGEIVTVGKTEGVGVFSGDSGGRRVKSVLHTGSIVNTILHASTAASGGKSVIA